MTEKQPVLYLSHGAPPLLDDELWMSQLAKWSANVGKPRGIVIVSAHWESAPISISATAAALFEILRSAAVAKAAIR